MKIDRNLYLTMTVDQDDGSAIHVHSAPVSLAVFEDNALVFGKTFSLIYSQGIGYRTAPRIAGLLMRRSCEATLGEDDGPRLYERIMGEIRRLTNVLVPKGNGWDTMPIEEAAKGILDPEILSEIENAIVFFSVGWRMHTRAERTGILTEAARLWGGSLSSSNCTAFAGSLAISTEKDSSGEKPTAVLSVPH